MPVEIIIQEHMRKFQDLKIPRNIVLQYIMIKM